MFKTNVLVVFAVALLMSCSTTKTSFYPEHKFAPEQLKKDFAILKETLEANHPSLYWYTTKDSLDWLYDAIATGITDSLTEAQFRNKVAYWVSNVHCGHTSTRASKAYIKYFEKKKLPLFPFNIKVWSDSAVVINNLLRNDSALKRGTIILAINNYSTSKIIDSISSLISTDGFSNNFKHQAISFNFGAYYKNAFGIDSQYTIKYLDSNGLEHIHISKNYVYITDTAKKVIKKPVVLISKKQQKENELSASRNMRIDSSKNMAVMEVNTFSKGKLRKFFRKSFNTLKEKKVQNLVIDLRRNTGGSISLSTLFTSYLAQKPFKIADTVAAQSRSFHNKKYIHHWLIYWMSLHLAGKRKQDNRIHFQYFEKGIFKPKKNNHFDGQVFLLIGGYTFSAATLVTNNLKGQQNVTIIGEETGGGSYGNSAIHIPDIVLPNSKIRVRLPLFRVVLNKNNPKTGRGIFPDIDTYPSSQNIKKGIDNKMEKVIELIKSGGN